VASRFILSERPASAAHDLVSALATKLLAPCHGEGNFRTYSATFDLPGAKVDASYEKDARTKQVRPVNFDVETALGVIRCGSSAFTTAALVVGISLDTPKKAKK
jgi:hypothetical protein